MADVDLEAVIDEVMMIVVAEQSRAFIDIVTDGLIRWEGPHSRLALHLSGLEGREICRWLDGNLYDRRLAVVGPVGYVAPFLLHEFRVASSVARREAVKCVLPGPVCVARLAEDEHYRDLDALVDDLATALAAEVAALAAAGASCFQLDEPLLGRHPEDVERVVRTASRIFAAAGTGATTILGTGPGDFSSIVGDLDRLPGTHIGLDPISTPSGFDLLGRLPEGRGYMLGVFDASTTMQEDAAEIAERLQPHRDRLTRCDLIVGPNGGLEPLPRDAAYDKLLHSRYLVEQLSREWTWA